MMDGGGNRVALTSSSETSNDTTDTLGGHLVAGCFLLSFGSAFLALTAFRLNRIATALAFLERSESSPRNSTATTSNGGIRATTTTSENRHFHDNDSFHDDEDEDDHHHLDDHSHHHTMTLIEASEQQHTDVANPSDYVTLWARTFCRQHIPEDNTTVVYRTSVALLLSTTCGLVLESVGGLLIHFEDHPDYTLVSYSLHETITLLFLVAGITGWWEAVGYLPRDSIRVALVAAFGGEALLWHVHASRKADTTTAWIHEAMSWLGAGTALTMLLSISISHRGGGGESRTSNSSIPRSRGGVRALQDTVVDSAGEYPCTLFVLYISAFVLITWQGCWFITAGKHSSSPMQSDRVPCYFVLQGLLLFVMVQVYLIVLVRRYQPKQQYERIRDSSIVRESSPARLQVELNGA